ncbi:putative c2h2 finger domain-containing protein [Phaeomoniella chlamydospora]|uniref:Putative c2h2 finger domain-containing protein n=1 Tax=Phaeomoniella chlamydospora TaxID=158046 RepID=A0A0G2H8J4_PHACM|nr:putative c2h2 finger domain-containing protein [Phaeomoniella chlamydospora]
MLNTETHLAQSANSPRHNSTPSTQDFLSPNDDYLSPGDSSEHFTSDHSASPSIDDLLWAQSYDNHQELDLFPPLSETLQGDYQHNQGSPSTTYFHDHLSTLVLTPRSSNIHTPPTCLDFAEDKKFEEPPKAMETADPFANRQRTAGKPSLTLDSQLTPAQSRASSNGSPADKTTRMPSPVVLVSNYSRGDSPARSARCQVRPSHKRSRSSRSSGLLNVEPTHDSSDDDADDESGSNHDQTFESPHWLDERTGYHGLDPTSRTDGFVPSFKEMEEAQRVANRIAEVEDWLDKSETGSSADPREPVPLRKIVSKRRRAVSAGNMGLGFEITNQRTVPGPGLLIDEETGEEEETSSEHVDTSDPESPPATVDTKAHLHDRGYFPPSINVPVGAQPENEEPLPRQFVRPQPWHDPFTGGIIEGEQNQPATASAAMYKYELQSARFETASRAATWGTRRRISESDIRSLLSDESSLRRLSITPLASPGDRSRKSSFFGPFGQALDHARGIIRRPSINKAKSPPPNTSSDPTAPEKKRDSTSSVKPLERISSFGRASKSPPLNTGSAFMAMTGQMAAIGGSGGVGNPAVSPSVTRMKSIKRQRSRSEIPTSKAEGSPGLAQLMTNIGGPPMPTLASPVQEKPIPQPIVPQKRHSDDEGEGDDDEMEEEGAIPERGIKMDLHVRRANIVPDLEGFKVHARELNPRIPEYLLDRIANEQIRRYKRLIELKVKHIQTVERTKRCTSGDRCNNLGSGPKILDLRRGSRDAVSTSQFAVKLEDDSDFDGGSDTIEGIINPAQFPEGIPLPRVKRLPSEFECTLCFKVKKFQKPSDWTKHVHEDVQPFTCTFPCCSEPKSFKRKADWVRHENERHRKLEWWQCNAPDCTHICYRKDNFVQHLVREHKKPEPRMKPRGTVNKATLAEARGVDEVWRLVDECHHEPSKKARDEPCRFCGNVCGTWKTLTVHLAKHMEQISLPVLKLVEQKHLSADTVISPAPAQPRPQYGPTLSPERNASALDWQSSVTMSRGSSHTMTGDLLCPPQSFQHTSQSYGNMPHFHASTRAQTVAQNMSLSPEPGTYDSYATNNFTPQPGLPINNPTASTYPPPFNAVPRHMQRPSPTPSHGSAPAFDMAINTLYTGQANDHHMFASPVDGSIGFQTLPDGLPMNMGADINTNMNMQPFGQGFGQRQLQDTYTYDMTMNQDQQQGQYNGHTHPGYQY